MTREDQILKAVTDAANEAAMICPQCANDRDRDTKDWFTPWRDCSYCRKFISARRARNRRDNKYAREHPLTQEDRDRAMAMATELERRARAGEI
jgi:hypothetical protein